MKPDKQWEEEVERATQSAEQMRHEIPHIVKAHYDPKLRRIILSVSSGAWFAFRPEDAQGLEHATDAQLKKMEISFSGYGVYFPLLDEDFWYPSLLQGQFGTRKWMAARLGSAGGASRSKAKVTAARANGKLGGRPRKTAS
ncbi:MAG: DUF2442 domain-containing protein [Acidobacteriota bacterium]